MSASASGPATTSVPAGTRAARSAAFVSSAMATTAGRHRCACSASSSTDDPAPSAATENRSPSASITSSACTPIDPVDPATTTDVVTARGY